MIELQIKVRDYDLAPVAGGYKKVSMPGRLYAYFDRDIYLSADAYAEYKSILENCMVRELACNENIAALEQTISKYLKIWYSNNTASFQVPDYQYHKIDKYPYFDAV